jgi:Fur family ferric uptake transcriptional regulator
MGKLLKKCQKRGLKLTSQREVVISILENSEDHPDVDELFRRATEIDKSVSIATVYRTVKLLEDANFIEKHEFGDGKARYEESGEHHEHLIDIETGEVIEFIDNELEELKEKIALKMGYELVDHRLELFGKKLKIN